MVVVKAAKQEELLLPRRILKELHLRVGERVELDVTDSTVRFVKCDRKGESADEHLRELLDKGFSLGAVNRIDRETIYEDIA